MNALALGIYHDLRRRRLLPLAVLLLVAAIALPVVALKPAEEPPAPAAAAASPTATASTPAGLPSPEQALSDKPLVSLAVLDQPSDLGEFESKNPFKPIEQVSSSGASSGGGSDPTAPSGDAGSTGGDSGSTGGSGGGGSTGGSGGGGGGTGGGGGGQDNGTTTPQAPKQDEAQPKTEKKLTYALDMTIRGPKGVRSYRGLPKLSLLPAADNPLLVFLGIEDAGTKAVFLVDAKLKSQPGGEGTCTPSADQCATLALAPGEEHTLVNDQGQTWTLRIVEVRETTVAKAAKAARKAQKRRARQARQARNVANEPPAPRFVPPLITDLFTGGRS